MYNFQSVHVNKVLESHRYHECRMQNRTFSRLRNKKWDILDKNILHLKKMWYNLKARWKCRWIEGGQRTRPFAFSINLALHILYYTSTMLCKMLWMVKEKLKCNAALFKLLMGIFHQPRTSFCTILVWGYVRWYVRCEVRCYKKWCHKNRKAKIQCGWLNTVSVT